jgi:aminopeptidase
MADEVGLSLEEYWNQIIKACYLDFQDPISERKKTENRLSNIKKHLDDMYIEYVHIK